MSDKTKQEKQAKQAAASWTAPTSVLYDRVLSPMYDEVARVLWPAWLHPNYITLLGGAHRTHIQPASSPQIAPAPKPHRHEPLPQP